MLCNDVNDEADSGDNKVVVGAWLAAIAIGVKNREVTKIVVIVFIIMPSY
ncbi:hypothetical protein VSU01S_14830 [Vibrio superstes NBRC 103154]|uniref:Uncharacterized protein n=1 Tax=Vibrio superstes NBRC 103154 TaxID=1219062 RepID=A0A511QPI2_9VIBR|nr:hypothetical protein VSU01S_14830 [Vibrio superstes NBRC 103154]